MQMGRVEIWGKVTIPHISIHFHTMPEQLSAKDQQVLDECLVALLGSVGATLTRTDNLVPCFDLAELDRRNKSVRRSTQSCS